ncbi:MAG: DUF6249 domain-containing protein [Cyclobacteriaceae bacterium]
MDELIPIVAIVAVFGTGILFVSTLTNYALKKRLIEKDMVNEETANMFKSMTSKQNALKWGLIVLFAGIGLIIIDFMRLDGDDPMPYGIEAVCVSLGFLLYYYIVKNEDDK